MQFLLYSCLTFFGFSSCFSLTVKRAFNCGSQTLKTQNNGEITSHGGFSSGLHYGKNLDCTWTIEAPPGMFVALRAETFDVEDTSPCTFDYLQVYDGNSTLAPSIGKFCGNNFNPLTSSGRDLTLEFFTDDSTQLSGFKLFYNFTQTRIISCSRHRFACANGRCIPQAYRCDTDDDCNDGSDEQNCPAITTGCLQSEFSCTNRNCVPRNFLCDGDNDCGDGSDELITNCNVGGGTATIIPVIPGVSPTSSAICGQLNLTGTSGTIESPNYPNMYPDGTDCKFEIFAPAGTKSLAFRFADIFGLEAVDSCTYDYVTVYTDGHSITHGPFCGNTSPGQFTLPGAHAIVEFHSDDNDDYQGFKLEWKVIA